MASKMIEHTLDLPPMPSMDEYFSDPAPDDYEEQLDIQNQAALDGALMLANQAEVALDIKNGDGHAQSMDEIHSETLQAARDLVSLGFEVDQRSQATIFEKATMMYKVALDAKDSKRKYQLEAKKLLQNDRKLMLEEMRLKHEMGDKVIESEATVIVEDRNELIKRIREQKAQATNTDK